MQYHHFCSKRYNEPTLNRGEVIDITIENSISISAVSEWKVSSVVSILNHKWICFNVDLGKNKKNKPIRNARRTNWEIFKAKLVVFRHNKSGTVHSFMQIVKSVNELGKNLTRKTHVHYQKLLIVESWNKNVTTITKKSWKQIQKHETSRRLASCTRC